jgi:hypothetical protein
MLHDAPLQAVPGDLPRRWISDDYFDLIVWYDAWPAGGRIRGFQLCYGKPGDEAALTWIDGRGFAHAAIDAGEDDPSVNRTPMLVAGGRFPRDKVVAEFTRRSAGLRADVRELVAAKLLEFRAQ